MYQKLSAVSSDFDQPWLTFEQPEHINYCINNVHSVDIIY